MTRKYSKRNILTLAQKKKYLLEKKTSNANNAFFQKTERF